MIIILSCSNMNIFLDTETSGLPVFSDQRGKRNFPKYTDLDKYDSCRIVSICWIVTKKDVITDQSYFVIRPDEFTISPESEKIHGISQAQAMKEGTNLKTVLSLLQDAISKCEHVVGHNIEFDINVILSECSRMNNINLIDMINSKKHVCTMLKGRGFMGVKKFPKLVELYRHLFEEDMTNAHNAMADTIACYKCYTKMFPTDKNVFFFKDKMVTLTDEQSQVTFEKMNRNILIVAAAGSGKSTTIITRIKHLVDMGVPQDNIILTTFTRNAANDMKSKLNDIMGYKPNLVVGTIDSISKMFVEQRCAKDGETIKVEDYAPRFLEMIRKDPGFIQTFRYLFVDEYQDINDLQCDIINEFYKNGVYVVGVGDDSQNIYEFRGSNIKHILQFSKLFKNTVTHKLTKNFRSTGKIIDLANRSIEKNVHKIPKTMVCANEKLREFDKHPVVKSFDSSINQYMFVVDEIKKLLETGITSEDICIMSPVNKPLVEMSELLTSLGIQNFYSVSGDQNQTVRQQGCISLNTIHRAKGLEWDVVFLINMNDEQNRYINNIDNVDQYKKMIEANRRLFYVAVTRAKRHLYILNDSPNDITRFVTEVDSSLFSS